MDFPIITKTLECDRPCYWYWWRMIASTTLVYKADEKDYNNPCSTQSTKNVQEE